jgi:talin
MGDDAASQRWKSDNVAVAKQSLAASVAAIVAGTGSIVTLTAGRADTTNVNITALGSAVSTVSSNVTVMAQAAAKLAALDPSTGSVLLDNSRKLAGALSGVMAPLSASTDGKVQPQTMLSAATLAGTAAATVLTSASVGEMPQAQLDNLMQLARAVASATTALVDRAKTVAGRCDDPTLQQHVITATKTVAMATTQLATNAKVVGPCLNNAICQEQLGESARHVAGAVERLLGVAQSACSDATAVANLGQAASSVTGALAELLSMIPTIGGEGATTQVEQACAQIVESTEQLQNLAAAPADMIAQAKRLAQAGTVLVSDLKTKASQESSPSARDEHMRHARQLAEATQALVAAAKTAAQNPKDKAARQTLVAAALNLRTLTTEISGNTIMHKAVRDLVGATKQAAAAISQLLSAAAATEGLNRSQASAQQLTVQCSTIQSGLSKTVAALKHLQANKDSGSAQLHVLARARELILPAQRLVATAKSSAPTVDEPAAAMQLTNCARALGACLADLKGAVANANDACETMELEAASAGIMQLATVLEDAGIKAAKGRLKARPGSDAVGPNDLVAAGKGVTAAMNQLISAVEQGDETYTNSCARALTSAAQTLCEVTHGVAAGMKSKSSTQAALLQHSKQTLDEIAALLANARGALQGEAAPKQALLTRAEGVRSALHATLSQLPGQGAIRQATITVESNGADLEERIPSSKPDPKRYAALQQQLTVVSNEFNVAAAALSEKVGRVSDEDLGVLCGRLSETHATVVSTGLAMAAACANPQDKQALVDRMGALSAMAAKLLKAGKR